MIHGGIYGSGVVAELAVRPVPPIKLPVVRRGEKESPSRARIRPRTRSGQRVRRFYN